MSFVVEDGSGLSDSNSYGTVEEADAYFTDRLIADWPGEDSEEIKQAALIKATDYIEGRFGSLFIGIKASSSQSLSWPRIYAGNFDEDEIPIKLKKANFEYALRALSGDLAPDPEFTESGLSVIKTKQKVGPIENEFTPVQTGTGATIAIFRPYPSADMLLQDLVVQARRVIR